MSPAFRVHVTPLYDVVARGRRCLHGGAGRVQALSHRLTLVVTRDTLAEQQTVGPLRAHVHEEILKHKNRYALNVSVTSRVHSHGTKAKATSMIAEKP